MFEKCVLQCISEKEAAQASTATFLMSCSQVRTTLKTAREKIVANPLRAFYTTKNIKCPTRYLPPFSRFSPRTLSQIIPQYSETQGIYQMLCLSLRSNRQSLSRRQGTILIKTTNAVILPIMDKKTDFFGNTGIFESNCRIGKRTEWHATAFNLGLAQAGHCLVRKCLQNSKLCGS